LWLTEQNRAELVNTARTIALNGAFIVEMWVKFAKGVRYCACDETWSDGLTAIERTCGQAHTGVRKP